MKKLTTLIIALFAFTMLAGVALAAEFNIRVGASTEVGGHYHVGIMKFKEEVEKMTNGRVEVQDFMSNALGSERELIEGMSMGIVEAAVTSSAPVANFSPDFMLFDLPYLITDRDKAYAVMDGPIGREILDTLTAKGVYALDFWENGFRNITNSKRPIVHPEDVKGLKLRTMENPVHQATFNLLGATALPMAWAEVYLALQQGTIDGQENPLVITETSKLNEVQAHLSMTGHFYAPAVFMFSKSILDAYPPEIQTAVREAAKIARDHERNFSRELDESLLQKLKDAGMQVVEAADIDKAEWQKACQPIYDQFKDQINQEYMKALME